MCSAIASNLVEPKMKNSEKFDYILNYMRVSLILVWLPTDVHTEKNEKSPKLFFEKKNRNFFIPKIEMYTCF